MHLPIGTADELDRDLSASLLNFVSAHLEQRNTMDRAEATMGTAAKTAQAEAQVGVSRLTQSGSDKYVRHDGNDHGC